MKVIIHYEGKEYESATSGITAKDAAEQLYENLEKQTKMFIQLKDGGYLLLPKETIQRCVIVVVDTQEDSA